MFERLTFIIGVESNLIVLRTELFGVVVEFVLAIIVASIFIHSNVVPKVIALEYSVVFDHPMVGWRDHQLNDAGSHCSMVIRRKVVEIGRASCRERVLQVV